MRRRCGRRAFARSKCRRAVWWRQQKPLNRKHIAGGGTTKCYSDTTSWRADFPLFLHLWWRLLLQRRPFIVVTVFAIAQNCDSGSNMTTTTNIPHILFFPFQFCRNFIRFANCSIYSVSCAFSLAHLLIFATAPANPHDSLCRSIIYLLFDMFYLAGRFCTVAFFAAFLCRRKREATCVT